MLADVDAKDLRIQALDVKLTTQDKQAAQLANYILKFLNKHYTQVRLKNGNCIRRRYKPIESIVG